MIAAGGLEAFITANLRLAPARAVPEILLWQATPESRLGRLADVGLGRSPYWAYQWAGGTALARHLLDNPDAVAARRVLDLGCGGGLVAIAAARAGAREVAGCDIDPAAVVATGLNAAANEVRLLVACADRLDAPPPAVDLVLVGDLFYARRLAARVTRFLSRCRDAGVDVLVGDPRRAHLPHPRLHQLAEVIVPDFGDATGLAPEPSAVYAFR